MEKENLSNKGAQINFQVKGNCINANSPIAFKSSPLSANHAGNRLIKINRGRPEVKPVKKQIINFLFKSSFHNKALLAIRIIF